MQLRLSTGDDWTVRVLDHQRVAIVSETDGDWTVALAWGPLVPFPDNPNQWVRRAMHVDVNVSAGASVKAGTSESRATVTGWPVKVLEAEVVLASGAVAEHRLGAFYHFMEYGAVALVRAKTRAALDVARPRLLEVIDSGTPDWQADGLVVCVSDLFAPMS